MILSKRNVLKDGPSMARLTTFVVTLATKGIASSSCHPIHVEHLFSTEKDACIPIDASEFVACIAELRANAISSLIEGIRNTRF